MSLVAGEDDDAQAALERHALGRVQWLASKLGYADAVDATTEKWATRGFAVIVVVVIVALGVSALLKQPGEEADLALHRCQVDVRATLSDEIQHQVAREHPELSMQAFASLASARIAEQVRQRCGPARQ